MPFVRIVERDPDLPHQVVLSISQDYREYHISCNCMAEQGRGREHLTSISYHDLVHTGGLASRTILKRWREAHEPPLTEEEYADAVAYRWVWVDGGGNPTAFGAS